MNLLSVWVPLGAGLLTLAASLLLAWWLPRSRGARFHLHWIHAGAGVAIIALLVSGTLLAASNRAMAWVPTTTDLWRMLTPQHEQPAHVTVVDPKIAANNDVSVPRVPGEATRTPGGSGVGNPGEHHAGNPTPTPSPGATAAAKGAAETPDTAGRWPANPPLKRLEGTNLWRGTVVGAESAVTAPVTVWVPDDVAAAMSAHKHLAEPIRVVYFLHGYPGSDEGTVEPMKIPQTFTALMADHTLPPTIFVSPNLMVDGAEPDCVDISGRPQIETFVVHDVVNAIRETFPDVSTKPQDSLITGISSGAYCAPVLALRHPDVYFGAVSLGGYDTPELGSLSRASALVREQTTISHMVKAAVPEHVHLYIAAASGDRDALALADRVLREEGNGRTIAVDRSGSGGHSWTVWSSQLPGGLRWWRQAVNAQEAAEKAAEEAKRSAEAAAKLRGQQAAKTLSQFSPKLAPPPRTIPQKIAHKPAQTASAGALVPGEAGPFALLGWGTAILAVLLSILAWVGTTVGLVRLAGPLRCVASDGGARHAKESSSRAGVAWRTLLVVVGAVAMCLAAAVLVNQDMVVFASWRDFATNWTSLFVTGGQVAGA